MQVRQRLSLVSCHSGSLAVLLWFVLLVAPVTAQAPAIIFSREPATPDDKAIAQEADARRETLAGQGMEAALPAHRQMLIQELELNIDFINRVCGLSEDQVRRLRVATRGAAERSIEDVREPLRKAIMQQVPERPGFAPRPELSAAVAKSVADRLLAVSRTAEGQSVAGGVFWTGIVERELTQTQLQQYHRVTAERLAFRRTVAFNHALGALDRKLLFTPDQISHLVELVDPASSPHLDILDRIPVSEAAASRYVAPLLLQIDAAQLQMILSERQLQTLRDLLTPAPQFIAPPVQLIEPLVPGAVR